MQERIELCARPVKTARTGTVNGTRTGTLRWYSGFFGQVSHSAELIAAPPEVERRPLLLASSKQSNKLL
jgi:hypothetical protein